MHDPDFSILPFILPINATLIDVGANCGQSIKAVKAMLPQARVHSFEANPELHGTLAAVAAAHDGVTVHGVGLGSHAGSASFYVPSAGGIRHLEEVSMVAGELDKPWVKDRWAGRGALQIDRFTALIETGDSVGLAPDLIKIDVEGAESEVVRGFAETIERHRPILLVENGDWPRLWHILNGMGYAAFMPDAHHTRLHPFAGTRTNTFYVHQNDLPLSN